MNKLGTRQPDAETAVRSVHLLWHTDPHGDEKLIGVYATSADASSAIARFKDKPGFSEGGSFEIAEYEINKDYWAEGFARLDGCSVPKWFRPSNR